MGKCWRTLHLRKPFLTGQLRGNIAAHFVSSVTFNLDGKKKAIAALDNTLKIYDVETGEWDQCLSGHSSWLFVKR
ncbi:hypothetical protein L8106_20088 [Lyngbya sp. PCC 8106]|nr:hypothetical protein L8106_20088 [Lyngbya sp. PCC 8106]